MPPIAPVEQMSAEQLAAAILTSRKRIEDHPPTGSITHRLCLAAQALHNCDEQVLSKAAFSVGLSHTPETVIYHVLRFIFP